MVESASPPGRSGVRRLGALASFCYFWLAVGFTLGTVVLVWPVRWLTDSLHRAQATQATENLLVILLVVAYVAASFYIALRLDRWARGCGSARQRWTIAAVVTLLFVGTALTWRDPGRMLSGLAGGGHIATLESGNGAVFEFGAYPDSAKLAELARQNATVVSLQDPNLPVEREGVESERELARKFGLRLVSAPMVPWFSENRESLEKIRALAVNGRGHYYIHCGLGRDRVNIVKRLIESTGARTVTGGNYRNALGFEGRRADFDQGSLISLAPGVWLVPHPLKEELYGCFMEGRPGHVVLLFDSTAAPEDSIMRETRRLLASYSIPSTVVQVPRDSAARRAAAAQAAAMVRAMKPPVTVVAYHTPWHNGRQAGDEAAVAFADAFAPNRGWKITTGTVVQTHGPNEWTGGKETGC